jgi:hypothetical protein
MTNRRSSDSRRAKSERRVEDRRDEPRLQSRTGLRFLRAGTNSQEILHGELLDVSPIGVRLKLDEELLVTEKLLVEILDEENRCCNLTAAVIWSEKSDDQKFLTGCELSVELTKTQQKLLEKFATAEVC